MSCLTVAANNGMRSVAKEQENNGRSYCFQSLLRQMTCV